MLLRTKSAVMAESDASSVSMRSGCTIAHAMTPVERLSSTGPTPDASERAHASRAPRHASCASLSAASDGAAQSAFSASRNSAVSEASAS